MVCSQIWQIFKSSTTKLLADGALIVAIRDLGAVGARCGFSYYPFLTFLFTRTQVVPDGFGVAYMIGCDDA